MKIQYIVNILIVMLLTIGTASAANVNFVLDPTNVDINADPLPSDFTVDLKIDPLGDSVKGFQFEITFDSSVIAIDSVTEGNFLKQGGAASTFCVPTVIDNTAGKISNLACTILSGPNAAAPGTAATINGHLKSGAVMGTEYPLQLTVAKVSDPQGVALAVTTDNGVVIPVPEVPTLALLSLGLIGLFAIRNKRE